MSAAKANDEIHIQLGRQALVQSSNLSKGKPLVDGLEGFLQFLVASSTSLVAGSPFPVFCFPRVGVRIHHLHSYTLRKPMVYQSFFVRL